MPVTFLTGASSGIGLELAKLVCAEGHRVALIARREEPLNRLAAELVARGGEALAIPCDVSNREAVHQAIELAAGKLGPIDRVISNAGQAEQTVATRFDAAQIERQFQVN